MSNVLYREILIEKYYKLQVGDFVVINTMLKNKKYFNKIKNNTAIVTDIFSMGTVKIQFERAIELKLEGMVPIFFTPYVLTRFNKSKQ